MQENYHRMFFGHVVLARPAKLSGRSCLCGCGKRIEIPVVDVRFARAAGKLLVQLSWHDTTHDATTLAETPNTPPETRFRKVPTEADDRFFDAAAVMFPAKAAADAIAPSLQMGDAEHPVENGEIGLCL
jgi:hypothetical protein